MTYPIIKLKEACRECGCQYFTKLSGTERLLTLEYPGDGVITIGKTHVCFCKECFTLKVFDGIRKGAVSPKNYGIIYHNMRWPHEDYKIKTRM